MLACGDRDGRTAMDLASLSPPRGSVLARLGEAVQGDVNSGHRLLRASAAWADSYATANHRRERHDPGLNPPTGAWGEGGAESFEADARELVDTVDPARLSVDTFVADYMSLSRPVVLRGASLASRFADTRKRWARESLLARYGGSAFDVGPIPYADLYNGSAPTQRMSLEKFVSAEMSRVGAAAGAGAAARPRHILFDRRFAVRFPEFRDDFLPPLDVGGGELWRIV
jgi:hypothetical protein